MAVDAASARWSSDQWCSLTTVACALSVGLLLSCATSNSRTALPTAGPSPDETFLDDATGLVWMRSITPEMGWSEARSACNLVRAGGFTDWRLPDKEEIETLLEAEVPSSDGDGSLMQPLREPFRGLLPLAGYLFTGQLVRGQPDAPYVMYLRNGHVFNGKGYRGFVRCVRLKLREKPDDSGKVVPTRAAREHRIVLPVTLGASLRSCLNASENQEGPL